MVIDKWEEEGGVVHIYATILVERPGQKGIVIGAKGQRMKRIGRIAREGIEKLIGGKVYLETFVKVKEDWQEHAGVHRLIDWR